MQGALAADLPDWRRVLRGGWYLALPLVVLLAQLARGHSTGVAAFWGILTRSLVSWFRTRRAGWDRRRSGPRWSRAPATR